MRLGDLARAAVLMAGVTGCLEGGILQPGPAPRAPKNLSYVVEPVGAGTAPQGILLRWDDDNDPRIDVWNVYARITGTGSFGYVGSTRSNSFHENGVPAAEYYVTAASVDGYESGRSNIVVIDSRLALAGNVPIAVEK